VSWAKGECWHQAKRNPTMNGKSRRLLECASIHDFSDQRPEANDVEAVAEKHADKVSRPSPVAQLCELVAVLQRESVTYHWLSATAQVKRAVAGGARRTVAAAAERGRSLGKRTITNLAAANRSLWPR
jgi:hypothetical protein